MGAEADKSREKSGKFGSFKIPLMVAVVFAFVFGVLWGLKVRRDRALDAGLARPDSVIRCLALKGLFNSNGNFDLAKAFEKSTGVRLELVEVESPEEILKRLETDSTFDLVTLFSFQIRQAVQATRIQPVIDSKLKNSAAVAPDFRSLSTEAAFHSGWPVFWGLYGITFDSKRSAAPPSSLWDLPGRGQKASNRIAFPNLLAEMTRLSIEVGPTKDVKRNAQVLKSLVRLAKDPLSPLEFFQGSETPTLAYVNAAELAFPPFTADWKFILPDEKSPLWVLYVALTKDAKNEVQAYKFMDFLMDKEISEALSIAHHLASVNRELDSRSKLDARLKPSYLREIPLDKLTVLKDMSRALEIKPVLDTN